MADGPLTAGLLSGLDIRRQREANQLRAQQVANQQRVQQQQLVNQQQQAQREQTKLDFENADKIIDLGLETGSVEMIQRGADLFNKNLNTNLSGQAIFDKADDFKKRKRAIFNFSEVAGKNPNLQQALVDEIRRVDVDFSGARGVPEEQITELKGLIPEAPEGIEFAKIDPTKFTQTSVRKAEQSGLVSDLVINEEAVTTDLGGKSIFEATNSLRDDFVNLSKTFRDVRDSFARIEESSKDPSAAGDLALIFNFMKMLDPQSVVRESEFATAQNAAGVPERIRRLYNKVASGEKLGTKQRTDFVNRANSLFKRQDAQHKQREQTFTKLANNFKLNPSNVVINLNDPLFGAKSIPEAVAPKGTPDISTMSDIDLDAAIEAEKARIASGR